MSGSALRANRTWNNTVTNAAPAATLWWSDPSPYNNYTYSGINTKSRTSWGANGWTSTYKGASAVLFKSLDGVYDRPIVIVDGWDPLNDRNAYNLFAQDPLIQMWQSVGVDVWVFDPAEGAESMRSHIDDLAWALKQIAQYEGLNRIDLVLGISAGGIIARHTLAAMEHVKNGGGAPAWFTYASDPYNGAANRAYGNPVATGGLVTWDSPHAGAIGIPRDMFMMFRRFMTMSKNDLINICNPKGKFWLRGIGRFIGTVGAVVLGNALLPFLGTALATVGNVLISRANKSIAARAKAISANVYSIAGPIVDAASTKDLMIDWCSQWHSWRWTWDSYCTGTQAQNFRNEMLQFNGTGRPNLTKTFAFSQGSWASLKCLWPDQWGTGTCSGPYGNYSTDARDVGENYGWRVKWKSAKLSSPNYVGYNIGSGSKIAQIDLLDARCRNDPSVYIGPKDILPGSVSTVINDYVKDINDSMQDEAVMSVYFASTFVGITSSLGMTSATSSSTFKDVQWAPYADRHEDIHFNNFLFLNKLVYEFTNGDRDGTVTCGTVANWAFPPGRVGRFCDCDPNDANPGVVGACGSSPTCVPQNSCSGVCGRQSDGCGGYYDCTPCAVCGNNACEAGEDAYNCWDCVVCGDGICSGGESCTSDCGGWCGDGWCATDEVDWCSYDCGGSCNYNWWCEYGETHQSCPNDCY
jgi:hypothetical protein